MSTTDARAYPEILANIADRIAFKLADNGVGAELAAELGLDGAEIVRAVLGGQPCYIPKGTHYELSQRDAEIFHKWGTMTPYELAHEYDLSVMQIYRIYKTARRAEINKRQGSLFDQEAQ